MFAYIVTSTTSSGIPLSTPCLPTSTVKDDDTNNRKTEGIVHYDIGLGKNVPVSSKSQLTLEDFTIKCRECAVQYWMVSESVRSFPQPKPVSKNDEPEPTTKSAGRKIQPIIPSRFSHDAIDISNTEYKTQGALKLDRNYLDMNTLWVEMLIHHEQTIHEL
jgi:hypothetical protein